MLPRFCTKREPSTCSYRFPRFSPSRQEEQEYTLLRKIYDRTKHAYVDGKPRIQHPDSRKLVRTESASSVFVTTGSEFKTLSSSTIQNILQERHILVEDVIQETFEFDEIGMQELGDIHRLREVQGEMNVSHPSALPNLSTRMRLSR